MTTSRISHCTLAVLGVLLGLGSACTARNEAETGAAEPEVVLRDREYYAEMGSVWNAVLATYAELSITIATVSPAAGRVRSQALRVSEEKRTRNYMSCGSSGVLGDWIDQPNFKAEYTLSTLVIALENAGVAVKVRAAYFGKVGVNRMGCGSTGKLEQEFFDRLEARLNTEAVNPESR